jgi:hypothetical protein
MIGFADFTAARTNPKGTAIAVFAADGCGFVLANSSPDQVGCHHCSNMRG